VVNTTAFAGEDMRQQSKNRVLQDRLYKSTFFCSIGSERNDCKGYDSIRRSQCIRPFAYLLRRNFFGSPFSKIFAAFC
jgi:hypothetical protein